MNTCSRSRKVSVAPGQSSEVAAGTERSRAQLSREFRWLLWPSLVVSLGCVERALVVTAASGCRCSWRPLSGGAAGDDAREMGAMPQL